MWYKLLHTFYVTFVSPIFSHNQVFQVKYLLDLGSDPHSSLATIIKAPKIPKQLTLLQKFLEFPQVSKCVSVEHLKICSRNFTPASWALLFNFLGVSKNFPLDKTTSTEILLNLVSSSSWIYSVIEYSYNESKKTAFLESTFLPILETLISWGTESVMHIIKK